ncbi:site-specific DNA-methyltransferase [Roseovarius sp.]|uniref:site-specific DNA-methyltransferase n=1 Tax=Roseovarius sp. TaxID=1486281 RepID=UPI003BA9C891
MSDLTPYTQNAREHPPEQIAQIKASIEQFGITIPLLIKEDGTLIAGHGRLEAVRGLGLTEVPVIVARGWSDEMATAYALIDNRLAETSMWNEDLLRAELDALEDLVGADFLADVGFSPEELNDLLPPLTAATIGGLSEPDDLPETAETVISRPGDLWQLGDHQLICGDATDTDAVRELLHGETPNLMVADPPYGVTYDPSWRAKAGVNRNRRKLGRVQNDDRADWRAAWALFPGDVAYVWHGALHASTVEESLIAAGFEIRSQIIWAKERFALSRGHYHWRHEPCFYAVRKGGNANWQGDRSQSTVWSIGSRDDAGHGHGTQKPVECMRRAIENSSAVGNAIYDPFVGSGTTLIAAELAQRRAYVIEIDPAYVDVTIRRWSEFTGREAVLAVTGQPFTDVAAQRAQEGVDHEPA